MNLISRHLNALAAVIEAQSFEQAAARLNISQSAVSQRIKHLEEQMGQTLLIRSNPIEATALGQELMAYYRQVRLLESELFNKPSGSQARKLAIGLNADSLAIWFLDAVEEVVHSSNLLIDLRIDDQEQTHKLLKEGEVVGCISARNTAMSGCESFALGTMGYHAVCTPEFHQKYFTTLSAQAFASAPALHYNNRDQLQLNYLDEHWQLKPSDYSFHQIPSTESYLDFIMRSLAWGVVPDLQCEQSHKSGELLRITPDKPIHVPLYWHVWNIKSPILRKLTQALQAYSQKALR